MSLLASPSAPSAGSNTTSSASTVALVVARCHGAVDKAAARVHAGRAQARPVLAAIEQTAAVLVFCVRAALLAFWQLSLAAAAVVQHTVWLLWVSQAVRKLRKKLFFELAVAILGPGGNGLILVALWPGWLVVATAVGTLRASLSG